MDNPPIEQTLRPETVNELLLIDRINELHRLVWDQGGSSMALSTRFDPNNRELELPQVQTTLRLAGHFNARLTGMGELETPGTLRITARTHGPTQFGYSQFVSPETLHSLPRGEEVRLFDHIWRQGMHSMAKELKRLQGGHDEPR